MVSFAVFLKFVTEATSPSYDHEFTENVTIISAHVEERYTHKSDKWLQIFIFKIVYISILN